MFVFCSLCDFLFRWGSRTGKTMLLSGRLPVTDNDLPLDELLFPPRFGPFGGFTGAIVPIDGLLDPLLPDLPLVLGTSFTATCLSLGLSGISTS